MNLLAIETATTACAIALEVGGQRFSAVLDTERRHTEALVPGIKQALDELGASVKDLEGVVVDRGPGLFTGLRVGLATANALAASRGVGVATVTSVELLAHGMHHDGIRGAALAIIDARRGEVFAQRFMLDDEVTPLGDPHVTTARELAVIWATSGEPVTVSGDGAARYRQDFSVVANVAVHDGVVPLPALAIQLATNRTFSDHASALYLRDADAVANFTTRQRPT